MTEFHKFPSTPHIQWLGAGPLRDDKVLTETERSNLLRNYLEVEEKIDGANLGFTLDNDLRLRAQNRGSYIDLENPPPQFKGLGKWLAHGGRGEKILDVLFPNKALFGEWCYATHSLKYNSLPDLFLAFDILDLRSMRFLSRLRRVNALVGSDIISVPLLGEGHMDLDDLKAMLGGTSAYSNKMAEGLYVRLDGPEWLIQRAKLVHPSFTQAIDEHWSGRMLELNKVVVPC